MLSNAATSLKPFPTITLGVLQPSPYFYIAYQETRSVEGLLIKKEEGKYPPRDKYFILKPEGRIFCLKGAIPNNRGIRPLPQYRTEIEQGKESPSWYEIKPDVPLDYIPLAFEALEAIKNLRESREKKNKEKKVEKKEKLELNN